MLQGSPEHRALVQPAAARGVVELRRHRRGRGALPAGTGDPGRARRLGARIAPLDGRARRLSDGHGWRRGARWPVRPPRAALGDRRRHGGHRGRGRRAIPQRAAVPAELRDPARHRLAGRRRQLPAVEPDRDPPTSPSRCPGAAGRPRASGCERSGDSSSRTGRSSGSSCGPLSTRRASGSRCRVLPLFYVQEVARHGRVDRDHRRRAVAGARPRLPRRAAARAAARRAATTLLLPALLAGLHGAPPRLSITAWLPAVAALAFIAGVAGAGAQLALFDVLMRRIPTEQGVTFSSVDQSIQNFAFILARTPAASWPSRSALAWRWSWTRRSALWRSCSSRPTPAPAGRARGASRDAVDARGGSRAGRAIEFGPPERE